jgi:hypothetical protein
LFLLSQSYKKTLKHKQTHAQTNKHRNKERNKKIKKTQLFVDKKVILLKNKYGIKKIYNVI